MRTGLAEIAIDVEHKGNRPRIHLLRLEGGHVMVHFVRDLRLGLETLRRDPPRGRNDQGRALDIETRELGEIDDHAVDRYRRTAAYSVARRGTHATAHHLPERAVFVLT